jgi:hypothetical protein
MPCNYRVANQRPHEQHIGLSLLVLQRDQANLSTATRGQIDGTVSYQAEFAAAPLVGVGKIEVEPAHQEVGIIADVDWVPIQPILARPLWSPWDVVVFRPTAATRAVRVAL